MEKREIQKDPVSTESTKRSNRPTVGVLEQEEILHND
jgi:hypothetical protein